ncbi:MAG: DUF2946 domain-containing protein, partial [Reyranella sp.]|nr:DUF2946 domain-containing protein [Reyranella sp.]
MQTLRRRLRPLTWLALVAMLGLGLLPAVSHALAWAGGTSSWAEVCTVRGLSRVVVGELPAGKGNMPATGTFEDCPYCAHAAGSIGPPPAPLAAYPAPRAGALAPRGDRLA